MATALAHSSHLALPCATFDPHLHPIPAARTLRLPLSQRICGWRSAGCGATRAARAARASGSVAEEKTSTSQEREVSCCAFSCGVVIVVLSLLLALSPLAVTRGRLEGQSWRSKRHWLVVKFDSASIWVFAILLFISLGDVIMAGGGGCCCCSCCNRNSIRALDIRQLGILRLSHRLSMAVCAGSFCQLYSAVGKK